MKSFLKSLVIIGCILGFVDNSDPLWAQAPVPGTPGVAPEPNPNYSIPTRAPHPGVAPDFNSRLRSLMLQTDTAPQFERNSPAWKKQVKEANFNNMPMGEVIKWLRTEFPEINFVNAPEVEDVPVNLNLHSVTLDDIIVALGITSKGELVANPMSEKMVSFFYRPMFPREQAQRKISRAYSLAGYLFGRSPDETAKALKDLEDALEISWKMLQQANPGDQNIGRPQLNLHAPTKMLIAVGDEEQLQVIERFISQLERRPLSPMMIPSYGSGVVSQPGAIPPPAQIPQRQLKLPSTNNPASAK
jgi:hypothetical protein